MGHNLNTIPKRCFLFLPWRKGTVCEWSLYRKPKISEGSKIPVMEGRIGDATVSTLRDTECVVG